MLSNVQAELNAFAKYVIKQSRTRLTKSGKNSSKKGYDSLGYDLNVSKNSFGLEFLMEDYMIFQDVGVSGVNKKYNTPYSYTDKMPPPSKLDKWIVRKGIAPKDKNGKFIKRKSLQFMIARGIFNNGIKPSLFFTKPFEKAFKNLDRDIVKAFRLDVEQLLTTTTKDNLKIK